MNTKPYLNSTAEGNYILLNSKLRFLAQKIVRNFDLKTHIFSGFAEKTHIFFLLRRKDPYFFRLRRKPIFKKSILFIFGSKSPYFLYGYIRLSILNPTLISEHQIKTSIFVKKSTQIRYECRNKDSKIA